MTKKLIRRTLAATTVVAAATLASAAGPFQIRSASAPSLVATAPPLATVATAPFEDSPARLTDGATYYYGVYDVSGRPLDVSIDKDPVTRAVRIGFDDGNASSAPVDPSRSAVSVAPASIRADGLQAATVTIVPEDGNGVPLGRGLAVTVDAAMLWPLRPAGGILDVGDGTYRLAVRASTAGTGTIWITVEGIVLAATPTVVALPVDPQASLRDLAIAQLADMSAAGGPFAALAAEASAGSAQAATAASALSKAQATALALSSGDPRHDDNVVKTNLDALLAQLAGLAASPGTVSPADVRDVMDDVLDVARLLALYHLDDAASLCGACNTQTHLPHSVCDAQDQLAAADAMRRATSPDWSAIADTYARSIELALQSQQTC